MTGFVDLLLEQEQYNILSDFIKTGMTPIHVSGTADSQKLHLAFSLCHNLSKNMLYITYDTGRAKSVLKDLNFFYKDKADLFPEREYVFYHIEASSHEVVQKRLKTLARIIDSGKNICVVATLVSSLQKLSSKKAFKKAFLEFSLGQTCNLEEIVKKLVIGGYKRESMVESKTQFSLRGGILDIFSAISENPYRIEFFDDQIDSIRTFDYLTQLSVSTCEKALISPAIEDGDDKNTTLIDYMPDNTICFIDEPGRAAERYDNYKKELGENITEAIVRENLLSCDKESKPEYFIEDSHHLEKLCGNRPLVGLSSLSVATKDLYSPKQTVSFVTKTTPPHNWNIDLLIEDLAYYHKNKYRILLLSGNEARAERLLNELTNSGIACKLEESLSDIPDRGVVTIIRGALEKGFEYPLSASVVLCDNGLFGEEKRTRKHKNLKGTNIRNINDLHIGDYVVHQNHGIGIYEGIHRLTVDGVTKDYLKIRYKEADMLYVPADQLNFINKFIGSQSKVQVSRLGGTEWNKTKARVKKSVEDLAKGLLALYAMRQELTGYRFSKDTTWQKEFEQTFIYEETDDQLRCIDEVKTDMQSLRPMDRLLCGDVGYGKTEVAIRAAFKCVMDGKQVAYLVPTTILAKQHFDNFVQRMRIFPVKIEMLSRFRTKKEQAQTVKNLKKGLVDIVIGTHRILQKDLQFKDLGLLIVDEEQRFGVTHKERIKEMKNNVDVLTLTATPIPRTLHMAMIGIRDMSVINEPPGDRHPVQTYVMEQNDQVVRDAVLREITRNGQVYYLYNRVSGINRVAAKLATLVPEARIAVAHGQMNEHELERIMMQVLNNEIDVLICTTIIETGLDIPNVNTLIIEDSDRLGLSQLYQLRGRVGRSNRLAYAYLMFRKNKVLEENAEKRLQVIKEFTEFGSGFKIALRDLEIRGAGNVLGPEQHGHMDAVGYDLYCRLLETAVRNFKNNEEFKEELPVVIELNADSFIPESFIEDHGQRIDIYKSIAAISSQEDSLEIKDEIIDRFGDIPQPVSNLIDIALIRNLCRETGITEVVQNTKGVVFYLAQRADLDAVFGLIGEHKGRFMFNAGQKPHLLYKIRADDKKHLCRNIKIVLQRFKQLHSKV